MIFDGLFGRKPGSRPPGRRGPGRPPGPARPARPAASAGAAPRPAPAAKPAPPPPPPPPRPKPAPPPPPPPRPARQPSAERREAQALGDRGEWLAAWRLRLAGYSIMARNYRTPVGEIDLVAVRGKTIAFVEVKARDTLEGAAEAVGLRQQERVYRAAELFLAARPELGDHAVRFDVVLVVPGRFPRHIRDVWRNPS